MPYIGHEARGRFEQHIEALIDEVTTDGQVNFVITRIIDRVYGKGGYESLNRAIGVLECCKMEFARRRLFPYEDKKCKEHGEVYE